jgi:glycosyltransferase involved in cell wall biosynthesis
MEQKVAAQKTKILILHSYMAPYRIDIYNTLAAKFNVLVLFWFLVCPEQNFDQKQMKSRVIFDFAYLRWGLGINSRIIKLDILYYLFKFRPNIVIAHEFGFFTLITIALSKFLNYKVIINSDDSLSMVRYQSAFKSFLKKICIGRSAGLITVSENVKAAYISLGIPKEKIISFPIMHNDMYFRHALTEALPISQQHLDLYNLRNKKILLFVGRLVHVKGIDVLFKSFKKLSIEDDSLVLVLVGEGEELTNLQMLSKHLNIFDKIRFVGRFDGLELKAWYNIGSILILPSRFEPFGAVVNEALVSGMPVICSSIAGASTLINEANGALVLPDDVQDLFNKIKEIAKSIIIRQNVFVRQSLMPFFFIQNSEELISFLNANFFEISDLL